jgi:AmmeMemoRadiSam system protein B
VVLIAPDHFNQTPPNYAGMITTTGWQTPFGPQPGIAATQFKTQLSSTLPELYLAPENAWQIEHGVYGLVPYVKYYFPQAQLLTLALAPQNKLDVINIGSNLQALAAANFTPAQILLLVSTDFIHHGELATIDDQDARNRELLENFSTDASKQIDNDCPQCWSFALGWFGANTPPFQFLANQNSYDYSGEAQDITSYLTGYF